MPTEDAEEWRHFPGADWFYEVSSHGRARSVDRAVPDTMGRVQNRKGRVLKPIYSHGGYARATVTIGGAQKPMPVHHAVCEAWHGPRPEGYVVAHGDGDPANNRPENLRWATYSENALDTVRHGRNPQAIKTHCPQGHPYSGDNLFTYDAGKKRRCRICYREASRRADAKRRPRKRTGIK